MDDLVIIPCGICEDCNSEMASQGWCTNIDCNDRDDNDRCCCECGEHFDGYLKDDYCFNCWDRLGLGEIVDE